MSYYSPVPLHQIASHRLRSLARLFAFKFAYEKDLPYRPLSKEAENLIASYDWQNDLYALRATIRCAAIMADGEKIDADAIRLPTEHPELAMDGEWTRIEDAARELMGQTLADVERELILLTLECCYGSRATAAEVLGISLRTLRNKLREFAVSGLAIPQHKKPSAAPRRSVGLGHVRRLRAAS